MFGFQAIKGVTLIMTLVVVTIGIILIVRGVTFYKTWSHLTEMIGSGYDVPCVIAITIGTITIFIGIFGLMSICLNGYGMLVLYCVLLALISMVMIVYGLVLWMDVKSEMAEKVVRLKAAINSLSPEMLPVLEINFKCCGVEKYTDYDQVRFFNLSGTTVASQELNSTVPKKNGSYWWRKPKSKFSFKKILTGEEHPDIITEETTLKDGWDLEQIQRIENWELDEENKKFLELQNRGMKIARPSIKPSFLRGVPDWLSSMVPNIPWTPVAGAKKSFNWIVNWKDRLLHKVGRWMLGTSWEKNEEGLIILPYSCCKNLSPNTRCYGDPYDTWQEGCRNKIVWYWNSSNLEISLLFMCFVLPILTTTMMAYILKSAVREKYYY